MKIAVVAPTRFPIREPYAGGLEAFCGLLVRGLRDRGHTVDLYAARGSEGHRRDLEFPGVDWSGTELTPTDHTLPPGQRELDDAAFRVLRAHLEASDYDVVHNNSLHPELLRSTTLPLVTTLHCPVIPEMAAAMADTTSAITAVSRAVTSTWDFPGEPVIIPNCVDEETWTYGAGGRGALWFGRLTPEKGPHLAIDAARQAGLPLTIVGRRADPLYWETELAPRAGTDVTWRAPMRHSELAALVGRASVVAVTPMWEEPFGLVAVEAMATGTPVAAFARGGLAEVLASAPSVMVRPGDVHDLATGLRLAASIPRREVADYAREHFSLRRFLDAYLDLYRRISESHTARPPLREVAP